MRSIYIYRIIYFLILMVPNLGLSEVILSQPSGAKEYTLLEIEYRYQQPLLPNQNLNLIWDFAPGVSYCKCDVDKVICTAKIGKYPCRVISVLTTVDYENKTSTTDVAIEPFNIVYISSTDNPEPPVITTGVEKVVILYETDNDTPESNIILHNLRQELLKVNKKLFLLDEENDIFSLKEQGCYYLNSKNEILKKLPLPVTIKGVLDGLK